MERETVLLKAAACLAETVDDGNAYLADSVGPLDSFVDEAARMVNKLAPLSAFKMGYFTEETFDLENEKNASLPEDFDQFVKAKGLAWERDVYVAITDHDPLYVQQHHPATMGGVHNPVFAITAGGIYCEAYPGTEVTVEYVAWSGLDGMPDVLIDAVAWMCASLYLSSMGEVDLAAKAKERTFEIFKSL